MNKLGFVEIEKNQINEYMSKCSSYNIFHAWYIIEKLHNKKSNWISNPLRFSFTDGLAVIEDDLNSKAKQIVEDYNDYYKKSNYFNCLKNNIFDIISSNNLGVTIEEIDSKIDFSKACKERDVELAIKTLISEEKITTLDKKIPKIYYINKK